MTKNYACMDILERRTLLSVVLESANSQAFVDTMVSSSVVVGMEPGPIDTSSATLSRDGRFVLRNPFVSLVDSDTNGMPDVYRIDRTTGQVDWLSSNVSGNFVTDYYDPHFSGTGNAVVMLAGPGTYGGRSSLATVAPVVVNLVSGDVSLGRGDLRYPGGDRHDFLMSPAITDRGDRVVFASNSIGFKGLDIFAGVFVYDLNSQETTLASRDQDGIAMVPYPYTADIDGDGNLVLFEAKTDSEWRHVFLRDIDARTTQKISVGLNGQDIDANTDGGFLSSDGNTIVFETAATNITPGDANGRSDIFMWQAGSVKMSRITSVWDSDPSITSVRIGEISDDGQKIVYAVGRGVLDDTPVFDLEWSSYVYDAEEKRHLLISVDDEGRSVSAVGMPTLSGDGTMALFYEKVSFDGAVKSPYDMILGEKLSRLEVVLREVRLDQALGASHVGMPEVEDVGRKSMVIAAPAVTLTGFNQRRMLSSRQFVTLDLGALDLLGRDGPVRLVPVVF